MRFVGLIGIPVAVVLACLVGLRVFADDTGGALQAVGLIGQWSPNCAGNQRLNYNVSTFGSATFTRTIAGEVVETRDILNAVRLTEDKIRIRYRVKMNKSERPLNKVGEIWENVVVRVGNTFTALSMKQIDENKITVDGGWVYKEKDGRFERTDTLAGSAEKCLTDS